MVKKIIFSISIVLAALMFSCANNAGGGGTTSGSSKPTTSKPADTPAAPAGNESKVAGTYSNGTSIYVFKSDKTGEKKSATSVRAISNGSFTWSVTSSSGNTYTASIKQGNSTATATFDTSKNSVAISGEGTYTKGNTPSGGGSSTPGGTTPSTPSGSDGTPSGGGSSGGGGSSDVSPTNIEFTNKNISVAVGGPYNISYIAPLTLTPINASADGITYSISGGSGIVEFDPNDINKTKLIFKKIGGPVTLTATSADGKLTATCNLTVVFSVKFNPETIMIKKGETVNVSQYLEFDPPSAAASNTVKYSVPSGSSFWLNAVDENGNVRGKASTVYDPNSYDIANVQATVQGVMGAEALLNVVVSDDSSVTTSENYDSVPVYVDSNQFKTGNMYVFVRVKGSSQEGRFIITSIDLSGKTTTAYPKKLYFQTKDGTNPENYASINSSEISTTKNNSNGFAESGGKTLDTQSYFGSDKFAMTKSGSYWTFTMRNFTIEDPSPTGWQNAVVAIARISNISFTTSGTPSTGQNKAMFTVTLTPVTNGGETGRYTATATFDGFM